MKRKKGYFVIIICFICLSFINLDKKADASTNLPDIVQVNQKFIQLVNEERSKWSLKKLNYNSDILTVSQKRAFELSTLFAHKRPSGELVNVFNDFGINNMDFGFENIYCENLITEDMLTIDYIAQHSFDLWKGSQKHYAALLNPTITDGAVGIYYILEPNGTYYIYACSNFGILTNSNYSNYNGYSKYPNSITIDSWKPQMKVGESSIFTILSSPFKDYKTAKWTSSNTEVADVNFATGVVTAKKAGKTTITATLDKYTKITSSVNISVSNQEITKVSSIQIAPNNQTIDVNKSLQLSTTISPSSATIRSGYWESSNNSIVTVDKKNGVITGKNKGSAKVFFISDDDKKSGYTIINVTDTTYVPVEKVSLTKKTFKTVVENNIMRDKIVYEPINNIFNEINNWRLISIAKDEDYAVIFTDKNGNLSSNQGYKMNSLNGNSLSVPTETIFDGASKERVDLRIVEPGRSTIRFKSSENPSIFTDIQMLIDDVGDDASNTKSSLDLSKTTTGYFIPNYDKDAYNFIAPSDGKGTITVQIPPNVSSDNESRLRIYLTDSEGNYIESDSNKNLDEKTISVNLKKDKEYTLTVRFDSERLLETNYTITPQITFFNNEKVSSISINKKEIKLKQGESYILIPNILPEKALNKKNTWESSDRNIAIVDKNGEVTALRDGKAIITAFTIDGNKSASTTVIVGNNTNNESVTGVSLNPTTASLQKGTTRALTATVQPSNATNKNVTWSSSNTNVATVNSSGTVTAVNTGSATITAKTADGNKTATCAITVTNPNVSVSGVSLNATSASLQKGTTKALTANVQPSNATNKNITWSSSNTNVATVNTSGTVTAVNAGSATITAKTADGNKTATCAITVTNPSISVSGVSLNATSASLQKGTTKALTANVQPSNATNKNVTWSSSNTNVATVNASGTVMAVNAGSATITVKTADGNKSATCAITVTNPFNNALTINENTTYNGTIVPGVLNYYRFTASESGTYTIYSSSPTNFDVYGTLYNNNQVILQNNDDSAGNGQFKIIQNLTKGQTYYLSVKHCHNSLAGSYSIFIQKPTTINVSGVSLNATSASLQKGSTKVLSATVQPSNSSNKNVTWSSSNTSVATVNASGTVTAVNAGSATITVKTADGNKTATCAITITDPIKNATTINEDQTYDNSIRPSKHNYYKFTAKKTGKYQIFLNSNYSKAVLEVSLSLFDSNQKLITKLDGNNRINMYQELEEGKTYYLASMGRKETTSGASTISVYPTPLYDLSMNTALVSLEGGETKDLSVIAQPADAAISSPVWSSSDSTVATVDSKGRVTAVKSEKGGTATITAKLPDSTKIATCQINVPSPLSSSKNIKENTVYTDTISKGSTNYYYFNPTEEGTYVIYSTAPSSFNIQASLFDINKSKVQESNTNDKQFKITQTLKKGPICYLSIKASNLASVGSYSFVIKPLVSTISLKENSLTLQKGESKTLIATIQPFNAANKNISWTSSNTNVATVNSSGTVTAASQAGTAIITARSVENGKTATATIIVTDPFKNATTINEDQTYDNSIRPSKHNYYKFTAKKTGKYQIFLNSNYSKAVLEVSLSLFDSNQKLITKLDGNNRINMYQELEEGKTYYLASMGRKETTSGASTITVHPK